MIEIKKWIYLWLIIAIGLLNIFFLIGLKYGKDVALTYLEYSFYISLVGYGVIFIIGLIGFILYAIFFTGE